MSSMSIGRIYVTTRSEDSRSFLTCQGAWRTIISSTCKVVHPPILVSTHSSSSQVPHSHPNLNMTLEGIFAAIENSAKGTASEDDFKGLFADLEWPNHQRVQEIQGPHQGEPKG